MRSVYIDDLRALRPGESKVYDITEKIAVARCISKYLHKKLGCAYIGPVYQIRQDKKLKIITVKIK